MATNYNLSTCWSLFHNLQKNRTQTKIRKNKKISETYFFVKKINLCYQFCVPRNLRIDIKDRLEEYSQSIEIDIHDYTQTQKSQT